MGEETKHTPLPWTYGPLTCAGNVWVYKDCYPLAEPGNWWNVTKWWDLFRATGKKVLFKMRGDSAPLHYSMTEAERKAHYWETIEANATGWRWEGAVRAKTGEQTAVRRYLRDPDGEYVLTLHSEPDAERAEFIARACNSYHDLLAACEVFMALFMDSDMRPEDECHEVAALCRAAIAKATTKGN